MGVKGHSGRWRNTEELNWRELWKNCRDDLVTLGNYLRAELKSAGGLREMLRDDENKRLYNEWLRIATIIFSRGIPQEVKATLDTNILTAVFPGGKEIKIGEPTKALKDADCMAVDVACISQDTQGIQDLGNSTTQV